LYVGIMVTAQGPKVVEFNVRFGDPECQVLMPSLETDPVAIMESIARGTFKASSVRLRPGSTVIVVLAAGGYPGEIRKGDVITLPGRLPADVDILHAGTVRLADGSVATSGGRVLGVVAHGPDLRSAVRLAYEVVPLIKFEGCHYRRDIGHRQLRRESAR
ncbi:MAG: phosphoribosylglycinamide synthetase C domain-containing protein, partial [Opitutia bacterium]